jgi:cell division septation protein DedD
VPPSQPAVAEASFTIQVGAFKDRALADGLVTRLKSKGFAAYILSPDPSDPGRFVVRVGHYAARADAERAEARLRDQEKFKPFITNK